MIKGFTNVSTKNFNASSPSSKKKYFVLVTEFFEYFTQYFLVIPVVFYDNDWPGLIHLSILVNVDNNGEGLQVEPVLLKPLITLINAD